MKSYKQILRERHEKQYSFTNEGEVWTTNEVTGALTSYLKGLAFKTIGKELGRSWTSVENVIKSDIPRNYRNCIGKYLCPLSAKRHRTGKEWSDREKKYLKALCKGERNIIEISFVLDRSISEIANKLEELRLKASTGASNG